MSDPRRQAFLPYIAKIVEMTGMARWTVEVMDRPPDKDYYVAQVYIGHQMESAQFLLSEKFLADSPQNQRATIIHEVLHLHEQRSMDLLDEFLSKKEYRMWRQQAEHMIEHLARSIAPLFPLPDMAEKLSTTADYSENGTDCRIPTHR